MLLAKSCWSCVDNLSSSFGLTQPNLTWGLPQWDNVSSVLKVSMRQMMSLELLTSIFIDVHWTYQNAIWYQLAPNIVLSFRQESWVDHRMAFRSKQVDQQEEVEAVWEVPVFGSLQSSGSFKYYPCQANQSETPEAAALGKMKFMW